MNLVGDMHDMDATSNQKKRINALEYLLTFASKDFIESEIKIFFGSASEESISGGAN